MELADFRREIDAIDDQIIDLLGRRFAIARRVADYKIPRGIPAVLADRVQEVKDRTLERGLSRDMDPVFLNQLYTLIIDTTCAMEDTLMTEAGEALQTIP